jgi:hypothetical protein
LSCPGIFECGAVSLTHLERTLCMCVKIAAMVVHAIIGDKDLDCGSAELSVNLVLTRGHGFLLLDQ